jgi:hypothetical protein
MKQVSKELWIPSAYCFAAGATAPTGRGLSSNVRPYENSSRNTLHS